MKALSEPVLVLGNNAWGRSSRFRQSAYEVEQADVGREKPNFLGYQYRSFKFRTEDVGRIIHEQSNGTGWSCWYFAGGSKN